MLCCVHAFLSQSGPYFLGKDLSFVEINMMPFIARFVLLMPHFRNIDIFSKARIPSAQKNGWAKKRQRGQNSGIEEQTHADTDRQTDRHTHTHIHTPWPHGTCMSKATNKHQLHNSLQGDCCLLHGKGKGWQQPTLCKELVEKEAITPQVFGLRHASHTPLVEAHLGRGPPVSHDAAGSAP